MPVYSVPRAYIHDRTAEFEKRGERVVAVIPDGATFLIFTSPATRAEVETRG